MTACEKKKRGIAPGSARRYAPAEGSSTAAQRFAASQAIAEPKIAAELRRSADESAHLWWPSVAKLQAASLPIRDPTSSTDCFRRLLKTYLFARY